MSLFQGTLKISNYFQFNTNHFHFLYYVHVIWIFLGLLQLIFSQQPSFHGLETCIMQ